MGTEDQGTVSPHCLGGIAGLEGAARGDKEQPGRGAGFGVTHLSAACAPQGQGWPRTSFRLSVEGNRGPHRLKGTHAVQQEVLPHGVPRGHAGALGRTLTLSRGNTVQVLLGPGRCAGGGAAGRHCHRVASARWPQAPSLPLNGSRPRNCTSRFSAVQLRTVTRQPLGM